MGNAKYILWGILIFLAQILISEYINIWPLLYLSVYPLILIILPIGINSVAYMLIAFVLGLGVDSLSDGIPGLNAAACVALAYCRKPVFNLILKRSVIENINEVTTKELQPKTFILLSAILYAIFFVVYISLDNFWSLPILLNLVRLLINIIVNVLCAYLIESTLISKFIVK